MLSLSGNKSFLSILYRKRENKWTNYQFWNLVELLLLYLLRKNHIRDVRWMSIVWDLFAVCCLLSASHWTEHRLNLWFVIHTYLESQRGGTCAHENISKIHRNRLHSMDACNPKCIQLEEVMCRKTQHLEKYRWILFSPQEKMKHSTVCFLVVFISHKVTDKLMMSY